MFLYFYAVCIIIGAYTSNENTYFLSIFRVSHLYQALLGKAYPKV